MSIRCSGFASRSFIIGSRLWPPAMTRASEPSFSRDAMAPSRLVARSYSNAAGVCNTYPFANQERMIVRSPTECPVLRGIFVQGSLGLGADGRRLRGAPMSSRCSYCSGAPVPMTGDRGSFSGLV